MRLGQCVKNEQIENSIQRSRLHTLMAFTLLFAFILIGRLAYLQISQFKRYDTLSLKNQMSIIPIAPPRGVILDRNGIVLAENTPVYVLEITPEHIKNMEETLKKLQLLLPSITKEDIENFKRTRSQNRDFVPIPLKLKLTQEEVAIFASNQYQFTGVAIKARLMRFYPLGEITAHLLGYVGRINAQELQQVDEKNYRGTNFIGKAGIEKFYEARLHGQVGYQQAETDVSGKTLRILHKKNPISGEKLYLTIDIRLQKAAVNALQGKRGAIVAMSTHGGEILAMASSPSYDPNLFVNGISSRDYNQLMTAKNRPLYNRAVRGLYPPASTIKPFVGLAGLEKGLIDINFKIFDPGWFKLPTSSHVYHDWKKTGHGITNIIRAITVSCDPFFYQLGHRLGITALNEFLGQFGFGQLTQVDLKEEAQGVLPSPRWKEMSKGLPWYPGDTIITAIGQGFTLVSPLQLANATASLSQKGRRFRPHLLYKSVDNRLQKTQYFEPLEEYPITLKDENYWSIAMEGMHAVIANPEGSGHRFGFGQTPPYTVAGKTGTAQVFRGRQYEKKRFEDIPEFLRTHSLFIAFAPFEKPEIAVAVIVENNMGAGNIARTILDTYFQLKNESTT